MAEVVIEVSYMGVDSDDILAMPAYVRTVADVISGDLYLAGSVDP